jgi:hypothetical protein
VGWFETKIEEKLGRPGRRRRRSRARRPGPGWPPAWPDHPRAADQRRPPRQISPNATNATAGGRAGRLVGARGRRHRDAHLPRRHDASGDVIAAPAALADGQATTHPLPAGISFVQGLYVEATGTGTAVGALWFAAVD